MKILKNKKININTQRLLGYIQKESLQVIRDPSSIVIAFLLPIILMIIFGAVSLDIDNIKIGLVLEDKSPPARELASYYQGTRYFTVYMSDYRKALEDAMWESKIRGVVVIPQDFSKKFYQGIPASIQVLADGSEANTANFVLNFSEGITSLWLKEKEKEKETETGVFNKGLINLDSHVRFNPELKSDYVVLPGAIAIIMSLIGTLLTALVVAREWERGTMESAMATPIRINEIILGKVIPYFFLGLGSMLLCFLITTLFFGVPFRGSFFILIFATSIFLLTALGQGLIISTAARSQFVSSQLALMIGFLPALILSGFVFEIKSMPEFLQWAAYIVPARYFVSILQTSFIAGNISDVIVPNLVILILFALVLIWIPSLRVKKS